MRRLTHLWRFKADALAQKELDADAGSAGVGYPTPGLVGEAERSHHGSA
jgi:hypothetical protein